MSANRRSLDEMPDDVRQLHRAFLGETEGGVPFELQYVSMSRPMSSNELMRAAINSQVRGRPITSHRVDEKRLFLQVHGRHRVEIEVTPSNSYRYGRRADRSLKRLVTQMMEDMGVEITPKSGPRL